MEEVKNLKQNDSFQVQGSNIGGISSPAPEPVIIQKSKIYNPLKNTMMSGFGNKNYAKSPKYDTTSIYQQSLRRPNYKTSQERKNKKVIGYFTSPYQNKNSKMKSFTRKSKFL